MSILRSVLLATTLSVTTLLATATSAQAAGRGTWTTTNDPGEARELAAVALLKNGKVLIAGGEGYSGVLTLTELFDPTTNTYTTVTPLQTQRDQATATLLGDGRVLVAGGTSDNRLGHPLNTAELFDPATNSWTYTGTMKVARFGHEAVLLHDGRVLVMGGTQNVSTQLRSAEIYDPATGQWTTTGSMAVGRRYSNAVTLQNGRVLEAGDQAGAEVYDVATGKWSNTQTPPLPIFSMPLALLANGTVLAAPSVVKNANGQGQIYNPATNGWTVTGTSLGRYYPAVATLANGMVLIAGGCTASCTNASVNSAVVYIPAKGKFVSVTSMNQGRESSAAVTLPDGRVLMQGGFAYLGAAGSEIFTP